MFCGKCGTKNDDNAKFCENCGDLLENSLPKNAKESLTNNSNNNHVESQNTNQKETKSSSKNPVNNSNNGKTEKKQSKLTKFLQKSIWNKILFFGGIAILLCLIAAAIIAWVIIDNNNTENKIFTMIQESEVGTTGIIPSKYTDNSPYHMEDLEITNITDTYTNSQSQKDVDFSAVILNDFFRTEVQGNAIFNTGSNLSYSKKPQVTWSDTIPIKGVSVIEYKTSGTSTEKYDFDIASFNSSIVEENNTYKCKAVEAVEFNFGFCVDKANLTQIYKFDKKEGWKEDGQQEFSDKQTLWTLAGKTFAYDKIATNNYGNDVSCNITFKDSGAADTLAADFTVKRSKDKSYSSNNSSNSTSYTEYYDINKQGSCSGHVEHKFGEETFSARLISTDKIVTFNISKPTIKVMDNTNEKVNSLYVNLSTELITSKFISPNRTSDGSKYSDSYTVEQQTNKIKE